MLPRNADELSQLLFNSPIRVKDYTSLEEYMDKIGDKWGDFWFYYKNCRINSTYGVSKTPNEIFIERIKW